MESIAFFPLNYYSVEKGEESSPSRNNTGITVFIKRLLNIPFCIFFLARFDQLRISNFFPEIRWIIRENGKIVAFFPLNYYSVEKAEEEEESCPSMIDKGITVFIKIHTKIIKYSFLYFLSRKIR